MSTGRLPRQASWPFFAEFCAPAGMAGITAGSNHQSGSLELDGRGIKVPITRVRKIACSRRDRMNRGPPPFLVSD